ncbi:hypothetical protein [Streptomyces sp. NPDC012466]|uniref:hypothetical protein n=1 Tax=Streptomyces sp. NPDC012466 TaxID=3364835 RepID=UPI0036E00700
MRGISHEGKTPVDEFVGDVLGDGGADDGTALDAIEDGLAPGRGPQVLGFVREFAEGGLRYVGGGERSAHDVADNTARFA